jgi:histidine triad (HIT) family protein
MSASSCIFCRIIAGEIPTIKIYEDDYTIAFMDKAPFNIGHVLVLPKEHYYFLTNMKDKDVGYLFSTVSMLAKAVFRVTDAEGLNIAQSNGDAASQDIPHVHVHVIPRFKGDSRTGFFPKRKQLNNKELEKTAIRIKEALNDSND